MSRYTSITIQGALNDLLSNSKISLPRVYNSIKGNKRSIPIRTESLIGDIDRQLVVWLPIRSVAVTPPKAVISVHALPFPALDFFKVIFHLFKPVVKLLNCQISRPLHSARIQNLLILLNWLVVIRLVYQGNTPCTLFLQVIIISTHSGPVIMLLASNHLYSSI